jgi:hypothetical protein
MMNILNTLNESVNMLRLNGKNCTEVLNAFFANYFAALILLRLQDLRGLALINDRSHANLKKYSSSMSDVNFWGRIVFYPDQEVRSRMIPSGAEILKAMTMQITQVRIRQLMLFPLTPPDQVDWKDVTSSVILLKRRLGYQSSYFDTILKAIYNWDTLNDVSQRRAINNCFMFLLQSDPQSRLTAWFRTLSSSASLKSNLAARQVVSFIRVTEEDGGGGESGSSNAIVNPGTSTSEIGTAPSNDLGGLFRLVSLSPNQVTKNNKFNIRNGKIVVKRKKNFEHKRFKAPDFLKVKKQRKESKDETK